MRTKATVVQQEPVSVSLRYRKVLNEIEETKHLEAFTRDESLYAY